MGHTADSNARPGGPKQKRTHAQPRFLHHSWQATRGPRSLLRRAQPEKGKEGGWWPKRNTKRGREIQSKIDALLEIGEINGVSVLRGLVDEPIPDMIDVGYGMVTWAVTYKQPETDDYILSVGKEEPRWEPKHPDLVRAKPIVIPAESDSPPATIAKLRRINEAVRD